MAEVIGAISAVITIIETSIKTYDSTQKDIKLSETFEVVRRRLPIIRDTLETCKSHIEAKADSVPENVCDALEKTLEDCDTKATNIRAIFEKIIPGQSDKWMERYLKILRRFGKGNKVEELMIGLTEDVQLIVNHDAVRSSNQPQHDELEAIIEEIKSVTSSVPDEESSTMNFSSGGGAQTNNVNKGSGPWNINSGSGKQYNAETQNFVTKQKEDFTFRGPVGLCLRQAPNISPDLFVGRGSELDEITEYLHKFQHQACLVLGGMGGIGKSRLAVAYAESRSKSYTSVFWLNATSEASLKASFRLIAGLIFEVQDPEVLDGEEIIGRVHHWLSDPKNTRWLLIFDNYDDSDQFKISEYYPLTSWGAIIVTTRRPDLVPGNTHTLDVKAFQNIKDSLRVLQTRSKRQNVQSDPYAKRLAERLAGLPLALATAGTYLQRNTVSFERYLQEYERLWNIDPHRPAKLHEYSERTLYTTWDLSYARLEAEDSYAAQLLKLLAYFGNQSLWYELFYDGLTDQSPHWLRGLVAYMSFQGAMGKLTEYYFLEVHVESGTWSMHNCVHDWTLAVLNKNVDIEYYWYAFDCVDATINKVDTDSFGYVTFARSASHAIQLGHQRFLENNMTYCPAAERVVKVSRVSQLLRDQIQLLAAEKMYMRALAGYEKALGPDHISTLNTVNNLGLLYGDQGKLDDAEEMYTRALAGKEKALGPDHTSTLATVNNLGSLYHDQGKLDKAEQIYIRALAGYKKELGPDHTSALYTVNNLGSLYHDQGKLDKAEQMYIRALAGLQKALGPDHTSTLATINNLGGLYRDQDKLDEAEQMYTRALAGREKALGPDHTSALHIVNNLGLLYCYQGKLDKAEQMYIRALAGREKVLGPDHTSTLDTVNNLGNLYRDQGKLHKAEQMFIRALAGCEKALGPDHTSTLNTANNLGILYCNQGKQDEAEEMYIRALAGCVKALGPDHTSTLDTVNNLGNLYSDQGKLDEAEAMYTRALAGYEKALGPDHTSTLTTVNNLGSLYCNQGKQDEAEEMYIRALAGREKALGPDHTSTLDTVNNLGNLYSDQGKLDEAEAMYTRALAGYEKALGPDHTSTLATAHNLGLLYHDQGKLDEAEQKKALEPNHASTLATVNNFENHLDNPNQRQWKFRKVIRKIWRTRVTK